MKVYFKDYPSGEWVDWSAYLVEVPSISKRVESENIGEAGVIVFDSASISFYYETDNDVYDAFSIDLTSKQRYIIKIDDDDDTNKFVGLVDFSTISWEDESKIINFELVDKLSALNLLTPTTVRGDYVPQPSVPIVNHYEWQVYEGVTADIIATSTLEGRNKGIIKVNLNSFEPNEIVTWIWDGHSETKKIKILSEPTAITGGYKYDVCGLDNTNVILLPTESHIKGATNSANIYSSPLVTHNTRIDNETLLLSAGEVFHSPADTTNSIWLLVTKSEVRTYTFSGSTHHYTYVEWYTLSDTPKADWYFTDTIVKKGKLINSINPNNEVSGELVSYNPIKLIEGIVKKVWSDITLVNTLSSETYQISLSYFNKLIDENPFGLHPLEALQMLATSLRCYIYIDNEGNLVIQSRDDLGLASKTKTLPSGRLEGTKNLFWDKLKDSIEIKVISWFTDELGQPIEGNVTLNKFNDIKARNTLALEVFAPDGTKATKEALNTFASTIANQYLNFYGKRHYSYNISIPLVYGGTEYDLLDNIEIDSESYFITSIIQDLVLRKITLDLVSVTGYEYEFGQALIINNNSSEIANTSFSSTNNTTIINTGSGVSSEDAYKWDGGSVGLNAVTGRTSLGLNNIANIGDGSVSTTEFNYLDGVTSAIQTQLNGKLATTGKAADSNLLDGKDSTEFAILAENETVTGTYTFSNPINISQATGTSPLNVNSTTKVTNLNADKCDGYDFDQDLRKSQSPEFVKATLSQADGTAPLTVTSKTKINNMNVDQVDGYDFNQEVKTTSNVQFNDEKLTGDLEQTKDNRIFSTGFSTGFTGGAGFELKTASSGLSHFTVDNAEIRKMLKVYELLIKQLRIQNGNVIYSDASRLKYDSLSQATALWSLTVGSNNYEYLGNEYNLLTTVAGENPFIVNDIVIAQRFTGAGVYSVIGTVTFSMGDVIKIHFPSDGGRNPQTLAEIYNSGSIPEFDFARVGNWTDLDRQGTIYITTNEHPYMDIVDNVSTYDMWDSADKVKARFGYLGDFTSDEFGLLSGYGIYTNNGYYGGKLYAYAGSNIAGWVTESTKFYKDLVRLEASSTFKGLGVGDGTTADFIKVGDFTSENISVALVNRSSEQQPNPFTKDANNWVATCSYLNSSGATVNSTPVIFSYIQGGTKYLGMNPNDGSPVTGGNGFTFLYKYPSFNPSRIFGKDFTLGFRASFDASQDYNLDGGSFYVEARYYNSGGTWIYAKRLFAQEIIDSEYGESIVVDQTIAVNLPAITGTNKIEFVFVFFKPSVQSPTVFYNPLNFNLRCELSINTYEKVYTRVNTDKIQFYQSPSNNITFSEAGTEINSTNIKYNGKSVARFLGIQATAPTTLDGVIVGDFYFNSGNSKLYFCSGFNASTNTVTWIVLN